MIPRHYFSWWTQSSWVQTDPAQVDYIKNKPSTFPPDAHTHPSSDISDGTSVGKSILTATDVPAVLSILGITGSTFNNNVSRTLNSNYTISTTRNAQVSYSIKVVWTLNALIGGSATTFLEYSTDAGTTWITVSETPKVLSLLSSGGTDSVNLFGEIPANALVRIRTTSSNMTLTYLRGQEVLK